MSFTTPASIEAPTLLSIAPWMKWMKVSNFPVQLINILKTQFRMVGMGVMDGGIYGKMFVREFTD